MKTKQKKAIGCLILFLILLAVSFNLAISMFSELTKVISSKKNAIAYKKTVQNLNFSISNFVNKENFSDDKFLTNNEPLVSMENFTSKYNTWGDFFEENLINLKGKKLQISYINKANGNVYLKNGITFLNTGTNSATCSKKCYCAIEIDVNGDKPPNSHSTIIKGQKNYLNDRFWILVGDFGAMPYLPSEFKTMSKDCITTIGTQEPDAKQAEAEAFFALTNKIYEDVAVKR